MIYRNKDGTIYKIESEFSNSAIPVLPSTSEYKPLEDKVDTLKKAILELEEVVNYLLDKKDENLIMKSDLRPKGSNAKHFTKWMRKGRCPGCGVGCGSDHWENCWARKELLSQI